MSLINSNISEKEKYYSGYIMSEKIRLQKLEEFWKTKLDIVKKHESKIENSLTKIGLGLSRLNISKTLFPVEVHENDKLIIEMAFVPIDDKFKFIEFAGYTKDGDGKNQNKLETKSEKIKEEMIKNTGLESVHVNKYSLEDNFNSRNKSPQINSVLITIYI